MFWFCTEVRDLTARKLSDTTETSNLEAPLIGWGAPLHAVQRPRGLQILFGSNV